MEKREREPDAGHCIETFRHNMAIEVLDVCFGGSLWGLAALVAEYAVGPSIGIKVNTENEDGSMNWFGEDYCNICHRFVDGVFANYVMSSLDAWKTDDSYPYRDIMRIPDWVFMNISICPECIVAMSDVVQSCSTLRRHPSAPKRPKRT